MHTIKRAILLDGLLISMIATIFVPRNAYAYIDPGMGSVVWQVLLAGGLTMLVASRRYWGGIRQLLHIGHTTKPDGTGDDD